MGVGRCRSEGGREEDLGGMVLEGGEWGLWILLR